jgi:hypothetical protein
MKRKQIYILGGCVIFAFAVLGSLFAVSPYSKAIPRQSFIRNFDPAVFLVKQHVIDLKVNSFYFAGASANTIYLGSRTGPLHMLEVHLPKLDTQHVILSIPDFKIPDDYREFRLKIDSPYFYLTHGVLPGVFKGLLTERLAKNFLSVNSPYFVDAVPVTSNLIALKAFSFKTQANELATLRPDTPYFEFKPDILEKQIDGIFCEEGILNFDKELSKLVYVYSYRNEYIVMDTSLNVLQRHHTIDTFSRAPLNVATVKSKNYTTLASPAPLINMQACVSGKYLFVQSPLLSKSEDKIRFQKSTIIDVYDFTEGTYRFSFYMNNVNGRSPSSIIVTPSYFAAIFDNQLILYTLNIT